MAGIVETPIAFRRRRLMPPFLIEECERIWVSGHVLDPPGCRVLRVVVIDLLLRLLPFRKFLQPPCEKFQYVQGILLGFLSLIECARLFIPAFPYWLL